jgi:hypothetical protein
VLVSILGVVVKKPLLNRIQPHGFLELFLFPQMTIRALPKLCFNLLLFQVFLSFFLVFDALVLDLKRTIVLQVVCITILSVLLLLPFIAAVFPNVFLIFFNHQALDCKAYRYHLISIRSASVAPLLEIQFEHLKLVDFMLSVIMDMRVEEMRLCVLGWQGSSFCFGVDGGHWLWIVEWRVTVVLWATISINRAKVRTNVNLFYIIK